MRLFHRVPAFELLTHNREKAHSDDYLGQYIILYFYPKANTPGCTRETRAFSSSVKQFQKLDAVVLGVSPDSPEIQANFVQSKGLTITMLTDPDLELARKFGALKNTGRILRSTFLIDRAGFLRWEWKGVKVEGHVEKVLQVLENLYEADRNINCLIQVRRSKRALSSDSIPEEDLIRLIEAAHLAPSCFNNQPWRFVIVQGKILEEVKKALPGGNYWAKQAPAIIAVSSHRDLDCKLSDRRDYFLFGCGLAVENLILQATQMGLVAHPIAGYDPLKIKEVLEIPEDFVLITLVVVGKPGDINLLSEKHREIELGSRDRKPLEKVLAWNEFPFTQEIE